MNSPRSLIVIVLGLALACAQPGGQRAGADSASVAADTNAAAAGCVRGAPEPLFAGSGFRREGPLQATEQVRTEGPIGLVIRHVGCAHFGLELEFRWGGGTMPGRAAALHEGARLLAALPQAEAGRALLPAVIAAIRSLAADTAMSSLAVSEMETISVSVPGANTLQVQYDVAL